MKHLKHIACIGLATTSMALAESDKISGSLSLGYDTDYQFRGAIGDESLLGVGSSSSDGAVVFGGSLTYALSEDTALNARFFHLPDNFGGRPGGAGAGDHDTFGLSVTQNLGLGQLEIGWNHHDGGVFDWPFLGSSAASSGSNEILAAFTFNTAESLQHTLTAVYDLDEFEGFYAEFLTSYTTQVTEKAELELSGVISYSNGYWGEQGEGLLAGADNDGFNHAAVKAALNIQATDNVTVSPYITYHYSLDVLDSIADAGGPLKESEFVAGLRATYTF